MNIATVESVDNPMDTRHFHRRLFDATRELFPGDGVVVCAVSGGADSMALLHGLHRLRALRRCGWRLHAAHLDHHLPHDSATMMRLVVDTAATLGLPCTTGDIDVPALARQTGESIEEAGRKARYGFLKHVAREAGSRVIAVAHHADDQAETVLHRILRGTGLRGLRGMPASRLLDRETGARLVRPLLALTRADCVAYLKRRGLTFMHDATNDDVHAALRNRLRHDVMPLLRAAVNPRVAEALTRLARRADDAYTTLRSVAISAMADAKLVGPAHEARLDARLLRRHPPAVCNEIILAAIEYVGAPQKGLRAERLAAISAALWPPGPPRTFELAGGYVAELDSHELRIRPLAADRRDSPAKARNAVPGARAEVRPT